MARFDPSQWEPLLDDSRLERLAHKLRSEFGHRKLDDAEFVTFIQPAREINRETPAGLAVRSWLPEMAIFAVLEPNPRRPAQKIMSTGTVSLEDWRESDEEFGHYANVPDPAHTIYKAVVRDHLRKMNDLRSLIN